MKNPLLLIILLLAFIVPVSGQAPPPGPERKEVKKNLKNKPEPAKETFRITSPAPPPPARAPASDNSAYFELGTTNEVYKVSYVVNRDGTYVRTLRLRRRYDKAVSIPALQKWTVPFNSELTDISVESAEIIRKDRSRVQFPKGNIQIRKTAQSEAAPEFSSLNELMIDFSAVGASETVELLVKSVSKKPLFPNVFDMIEVLNPFDAYESAELTIDLPADMEINSAGREFGAGRKVSTENGRSLWKWEIPKTTAKRIEVGMPDAANIAPVLVVSNLPDIERFGTIYSRETAGKALVTEEIQALGDQIANGGTTDLEKAELIYTWVNENIRYLLVFLGRGGWIPRDAADILKNRFGDCKDYTVLLQALLESQGIDSEPVVLRVGSSPWFPESPTYSFFNHMILYIPAFDRFADATAPNTVLGELSSQVQGKTAVRLGDVYEPIKIPDESSAPTVVKSKAVIDLLGDGDVKLNSTMFLDGAAGAALIPLMDNGSAAFLGPALSIQYAARNIEIDGDVTRFEKSGPDTGVEIDFKGTFDQFTSVKRKGSFKLPPVNIFFDEPTFNLISGLEKRTTPLLVEVIDLTEEIEINLPAGFNVTTPLAKKSFENRFGSYSRFASYEQGKIKLTRKISFKQSNISTEEYLEFRVFLMSWLNDGTNTIEYSVDPDVKITPPRIEILEKAAPRTAVERVLDRLGLFSSESISDEEASQLEKDLASEPDNKEARGKLIAYYESNLDGNGNSVKIVPHLLWLIRNHPGEWSKSVRWWSYFVEKDSGEYLKIRDEWLKAIAAKPSEADVRAAAASFVSINEARLAEKILIDALKKFPDDYRFAFERFELYNDWLAEGEKPDGKALENDFKLRTFELGESALVLVKAKRRADADTEYFELLSDLSKISLDLEKFERAKEVATEMILVFGRDTGIYQFDQASHSGNIVLGKLALRDGDKQKAADYLMIAVRAPLRQEGNWFTPQMDLAKQLFESGMINAVLEYLNECLKLGVFVDEDDPNTDKLEAVKKWIRMIKRGRTPSFDYENP